MEGYLIMRPDVPPLKRGEEITVQDIKRQDSEWELTRSNWRFFHAMQQEQSPSPGSDRRDSRSSKE